MLLNAFVDPHDTTATGDYDDNAIANFGSTATLVSILAYSDPGLKNQIGGFQLCSESGTQYPLQTPRGGGGQVPEPATLLLLGSGASIVVRRRYSRQSQ